MKNTTEMLKKKPEKLMTIVLKMRRLTIRICAHTIKSLICSTRSTEQVVIALGIE